MYREYELSARFDSAKSFYGKARVKEANGKKSLFSYDTEVCCIDAKGNFHRMWNDYSITTLRHVNEFLRQNERGKISPKYWRSLKVEPNEGIRITDLLVEYQKGEKL